MLIKIWTGEKMVQTTDIQGSDPFAWCYLLDTLGRVCKYYITTFYEKNFDLLEGHIPLLFTGKKDKNGQHIYQGDIIKTNEGVRKVEYSDDSCAFMSVLIKGNQDGLSLTIPLGLGFLERSPTGIEVIGNIYQNPELLPIA